MKKRITSAFHGVWIGMPISVHRASEAHRRHVRFDKEAFAALHIDNARVIPIRHRAGQTPVIRNTHFWTLNGWRAEIRVIDEFELWYTALGMNVLMYSHWVRGRFTIRVRKCGIQYTKFTGNHWNAGLAIITWNKKATQRTSAWKSIKSGQPVFVGSTSNGERRAFRLQPRSLPINSEFTVFTITRNLPHLTIPPARTQRRCGHSEKWYRLRLIEFGRFIVADRFVAVI